MSTSEKKTHEGEEDKQSKGIVSLMAQLSAAQKENDKLKGGIFSMSSFLFFFLKPPWGLVFSP